MRAILRAMSKRILSMLIAGIACLCAPGIARAEVTRVDLKTRADIGASGYEKLVGTAHFAVDPKDPRNQVIADLDKAPTNAAGRVEFSADFYVLRAKDAAKSNGIALVDVLNRGRKTVVTSFTRGGSIDPVSEADLGDRFLLDRGFTLVWIGWEFDVRADAGLMRIALPSARGVNGAVAGDFTPSDTNAKQTVGDLFGYAAADPASTENTLTVRDNQFGKADTIERARWTLNGNEVTLAGGFEAGRDLPTVIPAGRMADLGLGMAAFRDIGSWIKHAPDAVVRARHTLAFGSSQSGRFLRTFLYHGMNGDEKGRQVFDAVWMHIAGAAMLDVNGRGATPTSLTMYRSPGSRTPTRPRATRFPGAPKGCSTTTAPAGSSRRPSSRTRRSNTGEADAVPPWCTRPRTARPISRSATTRGSTT